mgnify:CR=1 FL=1
MHWILIGVGFVLFVLAVICQLKNMKHLQRNFEHNTTLLTVAFVSGAAGSLSVVIGLIMLVVHLVKG